jgi:hypothetical protein
VRTEILRLSLRYFALVYAAGFALGVVRVLWLAGRFGERNAELLELPILVAFSFWAARSTMRGAPRLVRAQRAAVGGLALGLMLLGELAVVLWLRPEPLAEALAARDPVAGGAYLIALLLFAAAPELCWRSARGGER